MKTRNQDGTLNKTAVKVAIKNAASARELKPERCCNFGEYKCQVPMPLLGRRQEIDFCIADIVTALNAANIRTIASCCGHGQVKASVMLEDGRELFFEIPDRQIQHETQEADEWIKPTMNDYEFQCCDCGLIHEMDFAVVKIDEEFGDGEKEFHITEKPFYEVVFKVRRKDR